jgi:hypothetical protein
VVTMRATDRDRPRLRASRAEEEDLILVDLGVRTAAVVGCRRHRVERCEKCDIDSSRDEPPVSKLAINSHGP